MSLTKTWPSISYTYSTSGSSVTVTAADALNRVTTYVYDNSAGVLNSITTPGGVTTSATYASYPNVSRVSQITKGSETWLYSHPTNGCSNTCTTITDPLGHTRTLTLSGSSAPTSPGVCVLSDADALSRTTQRVCDSFARVTSVTFPEGNGLSYAYDSQDPSTTRGDVVSITRTPKPASGLSSTVTTWSYDASCGYPAKCNKPNSMTDARMAIANYFYDNTTGLVTKVDPPAPAAGQIAPETRYGYNTFNAYYKNSGGAIGAWGSAITLRTSVSTCQTLASCAGTADEVKTAIAYGQAGMANNLLPTSVSQGAGNTGGLTATTSTAYDSFGNVSSTVGPLGSAQTTTFLYDADRELLGFFRPLLTTSNIYPATRTSYNSDGLVTEVQQGYDTSQGDTNWSGWTSLKEVTSAYDSLDRKIQDTATAGGATYGVTQYAYDNANRPTCTAVRMNPAAFSSPPSACALGTAGSYGPDRISVNAYDAADELTSMTVASGTSAQAVYVTKTYTNNGLVQTEADANNNLSTYAYDGFDRLSRLTFPLPMTHGTSNSADYESYGYDANDNRTSLRRRSGDADVVGFSYDALNRVSQKTVPSWSGQNVNYSYDLLNRQTAAAFATGSGVAYGYDALGRKISEAAGGLTISSQYDLAGDRTQITWPDGLYVTYTFDALLHPTQAMLSGSTSLATYNWNVLDLLVGDGVSTFAISRGNGAKTNITYDGDWRVATYAHSFANAGANETWTFAYNPANQIVSRGFTNWAYESNPPAQSVTYTPNGLNQYGTVGGTTYSYDARGNLTSDGVRAFTYDVDNQLLCEDAANQLPCTSAPSPVTLTYDPTLRLQTSTAGGTTTTFLYDGPNLAAEYNGAGQVLRRYIPSGLGGDTPLLWYEGAATATPRWLHADQQGSIVAYSDGSGNQGPSIPYGYGPYGEPDAANGWTGSRYRYTGQVMVPEAHFYYYKARAYDPGLGRFLQTDPVGYKDSLDLYEYVGDDPIDKADPTGTESYLVFRSVLGLGNHGFIVVTNSDGSVTERYSYGPQSNDSLRPGRLVEEQGNLSSKTTQGDRAAWSKGTDVTKVIDLNKIGFKDDAVVKSGNTVDKIVGTPENPGPTKYNFWPDGKRGDANSNSGAARVLEGAKPGSTGSIPLPRGVTPGWKDGRQVGTSPIPTVPPCTACMTPTKFLVW